MDHSGFVWIAGSEQGDDQLLKFTTEGEFVMQIGRGNQSGRNTDTRNVNRAADVYVYPPTNELFVADGYGNRRVIVFDAETGEFRGMWDAFGNPPTDPVEGEMLDGSNPEHFDLVHGVRVSNGGQVSDRVGEALSIECAYITQLMMGRTEPDPGVIVEHVGETAHDGPSPKLIEHVATAHQSVSRTSFSPDPKQRYFFVAERSSQPVAVLERESLRSLSHFGRVGDRPRGVLHPVRHGLGPRRKLVYGRGECGGSRPEVYEYRSCARQPDVVALRPAVGCRGRGLPLPSLTPVPRRHAGKVEGGVGSPTSPRRRRGPGPPEQASTEGASGPRRTWR